MPARRDRKFRSGTEQQRSGLQLQLSREPEQLPVEPVRGADKRHGVRRRARDDRRTAVSGAGGDG